MVARVVPKDIQIILLKAASLSLKNILIDYEYLAKERNGEIISINTMLEDVLEIIFEDAKYVYINNIASISATAEEKNQFFDYVVRRKLTRKINRSFDASEPVFLVGTIKRPH
jgi:hypothetical protein